MGTARERSPKKELTMPRLSRLALAFFLLIAVLASTSALAAGPLSGPVPRLSVAEASVATDAVIRLWSFLANLWSKNGCAVDPDGLCVKDNGSVMPPAAKNGCSADPSGLCRP